MSPADIVQKLWNYCNALGDEAKGRSVLKSKKSAPFTAEEVRETDCRIYQDQRPDTLLIGYSDGTKKQDEKQKKEVESREEFDALRSQFVIIK